LPPGGYRIQSFRPFLLYHLYTARNILNNISLKFRYRLHTIMPCAIESSDFSTAEEYILNRE
jgi:hypothetical protein